jgi:hypothetical protein
MERLTSGLSLSRREAFQALRNAPVDVFVGTLPEAEWWKDELVAAGASATCSKV